jgi:hypothetical protein
MREWQKIQEMLRTVKAQQETERRLGHGPDAHGLNLLLVETVFGSLAKVRDVWPDAQISAVSDAW